uniref:RING-type domain-containing protein n=1 Tax=Chromera velia CCMP2878 TaxID=1169474 RepID=A0A0G4FDY8_9ALVE|eukprot:Cvel_16536.t1-p1 / transcript=Cvel_16536.t1 / gene=Cvel_16536 / organism=Chromera_velia_CCMP2878 / gene_product=hypothetical protein / transcript_product=hypothetical protein / location=Cvel_scaffold1278:3256-4623(-) / protein_length=456 / sequence_SO=supercontig / SO=protein_coding / is_pseudo=false
MPFTFPVLHEVGTAFVSLGDALTGKPERARERWQEYAKHSVMGSGVMWAVTGSRRREEAPEYRAGFLRALGSAAAGGGALSNVPVFHELATAGESLGELMAEGDGEAARRVWEDYAENSFFGSGVQALRHIKEDPEEASRLGRNCGLSLVRGVAEGGSAVAVVSATVLTGGAGAAVAVPLGASVGLAGGALSATACQAAQPEFSGNLKQLDGGAIIGGALFGSAAGAAAGAVSAAAAASRGAVTGGTGTQGAGSGVVVETATAAEGSSAGLATGGVGTVDGGIASSSVPSSSSASASSSVAGAPVGPVSSLGPGSASSSAAASASGSGVTAASAGSASVPPVVAPSPPVGVVSFGDFSLATSLLALRSFPTSAGEWRERLSEQEIDQVEEGEMCPICLESFRQGERVPSLECDSRHRFHKECLKRWANEWRHAHGHPERANERAPCPLCNHPVAGR